MPALARATGSQCSLSANLTHVRHRIDGAIDVLQRDTHYYQGHRLAAIDALSDARLQLLASERYAVSGYGESPDCFPANESTSGSDFPWGVSTSAVGNGDAWGVRRWIDELIDQLDRDDRTYGGHRPAAIVDLQIAQGELIACEALAQALAR